MNVRDRHEGRWFDVKLNEAVQAYPSTSVVKGG
jgi:hypothetical protein